MTLAGVNDQFHNSPGGKWAPDSSAVIITTAIQSLNQPTQAF